ncbi:MAG: hypothetical protein MJZ29_04465 [Bacteroidaceae bacterium]|nr:hypothetical protein [Bacteroidaceae bacterium]
MIRLYLSILFSLFVTVSFAQKKEIATARDNVKSGKNLDQVEKNMLKLLKDSANKENPRIYRLLNAAVQKQYEQLNEKMYLKQSVDSAAFFLTLNRAFQYAFLTDSVLPNERKHYGPFLYRYLQNLNAGGSYFFRKEKYNEAYTLLDTYISCKKHPMFADRKHEIHRMKAASFRALCCGYRLNNFEKTVKHRKQALLYKPGNMVATKYLAETYQKVDSTYSKYVEMLDSGFVKYPCEEYFFTRLLNHQMANREYEKSLQLAEDAIDMCPYNELYLYAKSHILLSMEKYDECIAAADSTLAVSDSIADCYYIAGIANYYLAEQFQENSVKDKDAKVKMHDYYRKSMAYLEKYREREPDRKDKWGSPLYNIYLNLNEGRKFDEINLLLRNIAPTTEKTQKPRNRRR